MSYDPKWLRLHEARERIASSLSTDEPNAEAWLVRAIQDQLRMDPEGYAAQTMFRVQGYPTTWQYRKFPRDWPARLTPDRVDWEASTINGLDPVRLVDTDLLIEVSSEALDFNRHHTPKSAPAGSGVRTTKHASAEERCGALIKALPQQPRLKKDDALKMARTDFDGLSEKAFERQWSLHAPDEWKRQGAFKKPPQK
jgi:hypothetical protein